MILRSQVELAVIRMKRREAKENEGVVVEMVEALGDIVIAKITELANRIYSTGTLPDRMKESEFLVIRKKVGARHCGKHRTNSNTNLVAKIVLKVIGESLNAKVEENVGEE